MILLCVCLYFRDWEIVPISEAEWNHDLNFFSFTLNCWCLYFSTFAISCKLDSLSLQLDALTHPFFDELRDPNTRLPNGRSLPPLFNFKPHGMKFFDNIISHCLSRIFLFKLLHSYFPELKGVPIETLLKLIPEHARKQCPFLGLWTFKIWYKTSSVLYVHRLCFLLFTLCSWVVSSRFIKDLGKC